MYAKSILTKLSVLTCCTMFRLTNLKMAKPYQGIVVKMQDVEQEAVLRIWGIVSLNCYRFLLIFQTAALTFFPTVLASSKLVVYILFLQHVIYPNATGTST